MQEITGKLQAEALDRLKPLAIQLAKEGKTSREITTILFEQMNLSVCHLYKKDLEPISVIMSKALARPADSKIEQKFYELLLEEKIPFKFQYNIGPYRADYLVAGFLVVEIDGPQHNKGYDANRDKYMRRMGYKVIRVPIWILGACPEAVLTEIRGAIKFCVIATRGG